MSWFSKARASLFGSGSSNSRQSQRQQTATTSLSTPVATTSSRQRRDTITDASSVATAFSSGDPSQIASLMQRHHIRVTNSAKAKHEAQLFKVQEALSGSSTREDVNTGELREMKTFNLTAGAKASDANTFVATYFPMTDRDRAWSDGASGPQLQRGNIDITRQQSSVALTTPLSGCGVADDEYGDLAHVRPYKAPHVDGLTSAEEVAHVKGHTMNATQKLSRAFTDTFGPDEYHRYDQPGGLSALASNAFVVNDQRGNKQILAQTIYGTRDQNQRIGFWSRPFGPQPQYQMNVEEHTGSSSASTSTTSATTTHSPGQLRVPPRKGIDLSGNVMEARPPARRHSVTMAPTGSRSRAKTV